MRRQQTSGGWKSEYYGNLKQGAAVTALVLFAVSRAESDSIQIYADPIEKGFEFLKRGLAKHGYIANESGPDYAVYATALTLLAERRLSKILNEELLSKKQRDQLARFLCEAQLDQTHGLKESAVDFGGWDLSGWNRSPRESPGTNISVSSFALQAIADYSTPATDTARKKAAKWIARLQNQDGGFHFHPEKSHSGNKAGWIKMQFQTPRSYGTSTCDAIRALNAITKMDDSKKAAVGWMEKQTNQLLVPGFAVEKSGSDGSWNAGLRYYYYMTVSLERHHFSPQFQAGFKKQVVHYLLEQQQKTGLWQNSVNRMREDDPLIATSFSLVTLAEWSRAAKEMKTPRNDCPAN